LDKFFLLKKVKYLKTILTLWCNLLILLSIFDRKIKHLTSMKIKFLTIVAVATTVFFASCNGAKPEDTTGTDSTAAAVSGTFNADTAASLINWSAGTTGVTVYGHSGDLKLAGGSIEVVDAKITGGSFTVDMKSMVATDSSYEFNEKSNPKALIGHLATAEFFAVDSFPTAQFVIKTVEEGKLIGEMTIKGKTNSETIALESLEVTETGLTAIGKVTIDRQKYGVSWVHFMKDVVLANEIPLTIKFVATK
jgi:polyisoprenoid-binding protein YceI